jgi:hypothetical protein
MGTLGEFPRKATPQLGIGVFKPALPCLALPWVNQQLHWYHGKTRGVSHCGLAICINRYLKAKEELWKLKYFTMQKYSNLRKIL